MDREYYKQLHTNTFNNLDEMDRFLETYNLRMNHKEIEKLNKPITNKGIE